MKFRRVMIAAPKSGSGKTSITCALLQALKSRGERVVSYKCGPDYIDPMFHQKVIDIPSKNLDTFFTGEQETKNLFLKNRSEKEFAVLEGVMGLYDGLGGIRKEGSSYHLAKLTKTPIILVVDAKGMGRSLLALLSGFLSYDSEKLIKGVIFNRMSKSYYEIIKPLIEEELKLTVLGYFPDCKEFQLQSRHLGLVMPDELGNIKRQLQILSAEFEKSVSIGNIIEIAEQAEELEYNESNVCLKNCFSDGKSPVIAVAKDEAFCFYYEDNLCLLREFGAKLEYFSPIHDTKLPKNCAGLLLGGGYPELYAAELSKNTEMLSEIKKAIEGGMPVVAECGGFMYLHSEIEDKEQHSYPMVGVIPAKCSYTGKLVRFGYIELEESTSNFLPKGQRIKAHEFHYFDSEQNGNSCTATKPTTGKSYPCIISNEQQWMGFPHLYYPSNVEFARRFVERVKYFEPKK